MKKGNALLISAVLIPVSVWFTFTKGIAPLDSFEQLATATESRTSTFESEAIVSNNDQQKPLFVLHVGPSKTGTTTVQYFAQNNEKVMEDANVYYLGHNGKNRQQDTHRLHSTCLSGSNFDEQACKEKWAEIYRILDDHHAKNHIVLLSEERFSYYHKEKDEEARLWKYLVPLQEKWDVRVVYTYRRYYDWLPSKYYQVFNPMGGSRYEANMAKRLEWPDMKGKVIPSFPEFFEAYSNKWSLKHPAAMKKKYEDRFDNVWFFNMHMEGDFLPNFFCKMVPEAGSLCEYLRTEYTSIVKNPSTSKHVHFDMIAVEAYKRGWLDKSLARRDVAQAVEDFSAEQGYDKMTDFPLDCLTPEQTESLLSQSLSFESKTVPKYFASPKGEVVLREGFAASLEKHKFCTVDVDVVLEERKWQKFLKNMRPETVSAAPEN